MKYQLVLILVGVACAAALKCKGRANLLEDYAIACMTKGRAPAITDTHSCLREEVAESSKTCTADSSCTEVNIMAKSQQFDKSADMVWSFSSCYKQEMDIKVCAKGATPEGTTTMAPTTMAPNTTVGESVNMTTTTTTEATTTTGELTTTEEPTTKTTTEAPTTTTPEFPFFAGCWEGKVDFSSTSCSKGMVTVNLTNSADEEREFDVQVVGCCDTENCAVASAAGETNICNYGEGSDYVDTTCSSACFTYHILQDDELEVKHGCLADFSQDELEPYTTVTECTDKYEAGTCQDVTINGKKVEGCLRCCTGDNCNNWLTRNTILGIVDPEATTDSDASSALLPTLTILAFSWLISLL